MQARFPLNATILRRARYEHDWPRPIAARFSVELSARPQPRTRRLLSSAYLLGRQRAEARARHDFDDLADRFEGINETTFAEIRALRSELAYMYLVGPRWWSAPMKTRHSTDARGRSALEPMGMSRGEVPAGAPRSEESQRENHRRLPRSR
jgi:hypothetical protein